MKTAATTTTILPLFLVLNVIVVVVVESTIWRPRPQIIDPLHQKAFLSSSPRRIAPNNDFFPNVRGGAGTGTGADEEDDYDDDDDDQSTAGVPDVARGGSTRAINYGGASSHMPEKTAATKVAEKTIDSDNNTAAAASSTTTTSSKTNNSLGKSNNNATAATVTEIEVELQQQQPVEANKAQQHKAEIKAHKLEEKLHKAEHKAEVKLHKMEEKIHKIEEKARIKQEKKEHKAELKRHKAIAKKLKNRNSTNLRRKVLHASFGFFFAALNHFVPKEKFVPGMVILTSATLCMELLRYRKGFGWMNDIMHFVLGSSLRKHEMDGKFTGSFYYFLGVTITATLYPTSAATLGICQLAIADPTASYFGRQTRHIYWSRIENGLGGFGRNKGILGFLGGALACVPMNYYLLHIAQFGGGVGNPVVSETSKLLASLALGFAGAFADLAVPTPALTLPKKVCGIRVPPFHVDDNVVVPIVSGFACTKVFQLLHWPSNLALAKYLIF